MTIRFAARVTFSGDNPHSQLLSLTFPGTFVVSLPLFASCSTREVPHRVSASHGLHLLEERHRRQRDPERRRRECEPERRRQEREPERGANLRIRG